LDSLVVVGFAGVDAVATRIIRGRLREKQIRMTVVKNSVARQAFEAIGLPQAKALIEGPCAIAFSTDPKQVSVVSVVRELLAINKDAPNLTVKAAVLEGAVFGSDQIETLSRFPTRQEAIARAVACVLWPGRKLAGCLIGPGARIAGLLKAVQEKKETEGGSQEAA
jgi:large subunit ribosomal protein L10